MNRPRVAVVTINQNERAAVWEALDVPNLKHIETGGSTVRFAYKVTQVEYGNLDVDHIDMQDSGNVAAALITHSHFQSTSTPNYSAIILFGCAGLNPFSKSAHELGLGQTVLVERIDYLENGRVSTHAVPNSDLRVDLATIKVEKLGSHRIEPAGRMHNYLSEKLGIAGRRVMTTEKVLALDASDAYQPADLPATIVTYRTALKNQGYDIVDMESFGFMSGLSETQQFFAAIMRVITDSLGDHPSTTEGTGNRGATQRSLLETAAKKVLVPALFFIEELAERTVSADRRSVRNPPRKSRSEPRSRSSNPSRSGRPSRPKEVPQVAKSTRRARDRSHITDVSSILTTAVADALSKTPPETIALVLAQAADLLLKTADSNLYTEDPSLAQFARDLARFHRLRYGTKRMAKWPLPNPVAERMAREMGVAFQDIVEVWSSIVAQYDPAVSAETYFGSLSSAVSRRTHEARVSRVNEQICCLVSKKDVSTLVAPTTLRFTPSQTSWSDTLEWAGFEHDHRLDVRYGVAREASEE